MTFKRQDFVEIDYTGKLKTGEVFDTTDEDEAKKHDIYSTNTSFGPVTVCLGEGFVLTGLEQKLVGRELGDYEIELPPEQAFGKKSAKLVQLVPTAKFKQQQIVPVPGLQINVDGMLGTVRTVTGGRTVVDFNHPLSGRELVYHVKIRRRITDEKEKATAVIKWLFKLVPLSVELKEKNLSITLKAKLPQVAQDQIAKKIISLTNIQKVGFHEKKDTD